MIFFTADVCFYGYLKCSEDENTLFNRVARKSIAHKTEPKYMG